MAEDDDQFRQRLHGTFIAEAKTHIDGIPSLLDKLKHGEGDGDALTELLRKIHSLKGAAGSVDQNQVELLCQSLEQVLRMVMRGERKIDADFFDLFEQGLALLESGLTTTARDGKFMISLEFLSSVRKLT